jgi:transposase-like protein
MEAMGRQSKFAPEVRERAVGLVRETQQSYDSEWAAIVSVAEKIGCNPETLRKWTRQKQRDVGQRPGPTTEDKARIKDLEREVHELRRTNEILRKASAFFAAAELDRRPK